ncbi:MAG TPA: response regulator [Malonomonas sp.]
MTKKLLLADDSITIQKVIGIIFETEDYQLLVTDNGDDAFTKALEEFPDLVIADISMPGKDGFELCQAIKSDPRLSATSVMLLPGTFDHFDEQRAQSVGADGWLTKPFESQALLNKVAQLLETEPVRVAGAASAPAFAAVEAVEEPTADFALPAYDEGLDAAAAAPVVDEAVLGLDEIDVDDAAAQPEESADDIWDAISFEEDDLSPAVEEAVRPSFVAAEEVPTDAEEVVETFVSEDTYQAVTAAPVESEPAFGFADEDSSAASDETVSDEAAFSAKDSRVTEEPMELEPAELEPLELEAAELGPAELEPLELEAAELEPAELEPLELEAAELEPVELEPLELESAESAESYSLPGDSVKESYGLQDEVMEAPSFAASDVGFEELEPLHLSDETADVEELAVEEPLATEMATSDMPMFAASEAAAEETSFVLEEGDEEEILDLADEDILDEEPLIEDDRAEVSGLYDVATDGVTEQAPYEVETSVDEPELLNEAVGAGEPDLLDGEDAIADEPESLEVDGFVAAEPELVELEDEVVADQGFSAQEEPFAEEAAAPSTELETSEEVAEFSAEPFEEQFSADDGVASQDALAASDVEEDDGFYFDASETEESAVADVSTEVAAEVGGVSVAAAVAAASLSPEAEIEQVEQQLRQLSEEDLREVVARVAGPIIEKLASEMLQQIAWEVVPDLAETMIREEIRKIKHADA